MSVPEPDQWWISFYPLLGCPFALEEHELKFGPAPAGNQYTCVPGIGWDGMTGGNWVYAAHMADQFRMVVEWEIGTTSYNSAVTTHDWWYIPGGEPPTNAYEPVEAQFDTFFSAIAPHLAVNTKIVGYRWSRWKDDYSKTEPSFRYASRALVNQFGGSVMPNQVSAAITEETSVRRRWGRFYVPFICKEAIGAEGRLTQQAVNALGSDGRAALATVEDTWQHVTISRELTPHFLPTTFIRVDNVPDIIRRRRLRSSTYRYRQAAL